MLKHNIEGVYNILKSMSEDSTLNHETKEGAKNLMYQITIKFLCLLNL